MDWLVPRTVDVVWQEQQLPQKLAGWTAKSLSWPELCGWEFSSLLGWSNLWRWAFLLVSWRWEENPHKFFSAYFSQCINISCLSECPALKVKTTVVRMKIQTLANFSDPAINTQILLQVKPPPTLTQVYLNYQNVCLSVGSELPNETLFHWQK